MYTRSFYLINAALRLGQATLSSHAGKEDWEFVKPGLYTIRSTEYSGPKGIGMGAFMGMAGLQGMLRRTLYFNDEFDLYMILAALCGGLLLLGFLSFFVNIVMSVGLKGVLGIFSKSELAID